METVYQNSGVTIYQMPRADLSMASATSDDN